MTPGQAAFEKWASLLDVKYPITWESMPERAKAAWEDVAIAAIDAEFAQRIHRPLIRPHDE